MHFFMFWPLLFSSRMSRNGAIGSSGLNRRPLWPHASKLSWPLAVLLQLAHGHPHIDPIHIVAHTVPSTLSHPRRHPLSVVETRHDTARTCKPRVVITTTTFNGHRLFADRVSRETWERWRKVASVYLSVCLSVRLFSLYILNQLAFELALLCVMGHDHSSPRIESQGHKLMSKVNVQRVWAW